MNNSFTGRPSGGVVADGMMDEFIDDIDMEIDAYQNDEFLQQQQQQCEEADIDVGAHGRNWKRAQPKQIDSKTEDLVFQQLEVDYVLAQRHGQMSTIKGARSVPMIRMFGVTQEGNSVCALVYNFEPYFYALAPNGFDTLDGPDALREQLNRRVREARNNEADSPVARVEVAQKQSIWGYQEGRQKTFLKIVVTWPQHVPTCRGILEEKGIMIHDRMWRMQTYESDVLYTLRFMIDSGIQGASWVSISKGGYIILDQEDRSRLSHCQIEVVASAGNIKPVDQSGEFSKLAPIRVLSVDIECKGRKGCFPEADKDPVIQIASMISDLGVEKPAVKNILTLKSCAPIVGAEVMSFEDEKPMLLTWQKLLQETDPDIIIGYNTSNFDLPYLINRARTLKLKPFEYWGRMRAIPIKMRDAQFSSKAYGTHEYKEIQIDGRVQLDLLLAIQRDHKLSSYSLNSVSAHFLGEQKEDVHHSAIADLQEGNAETRRRLAVYCLKDAYLPQRLLDKLMLMYNYVEMARVTGVPMSFLFTRGQSIKVFSQILRKAGTKGLLVPYKKVQGGGDGVAYEGATVLDACQGFYRDPVATLDFASLYPSIMMAHNLCYTTLLTKEQVARMDPAEYERSPTGDVFVRSKVQKGILPEILEELLGARKRAKKDLAVATDPFVKAVMNGRQLALKEPDQKKTQYRYNATNVGDIGCFKFIQENDNFFTNWVQNIALDDNLYPPENKELYVSANSVYGFTGATIGKLPCLEISGSTTAYGRTMIMNTKRLVEAQYTKANGYEADARVIYGDTDSVMVDFRVADIGRAMELGLEAASEITKSFPTPVKLEFEKVYCPYLLITKKRYAGLLYTKPEKPDKIDTKGIETVRRDNCLLVRNVITTCLDKILLDKDLEGAKTYVKGMISDLLKNKLDLSLLVVTKGLTQAAEEYETKVAHVELAKKMQKRDPATAPSVGDRVPYVIVKAAKGAKAYEKAEDPIYALENNLPIDSQHYLDHHLALPLMRIFEPIMKTPKELLTGDHTRSITVTTPSSALGGIMKFAHKKVTCLNCKAPLKGTVDTVLCDHCRPKEAQIYQDHLHGVNTLSKQFNSLWTQCQRCQGSLHQDVLCTSRDCPIFYRRKKVQKDLDEAAVKLGRFQDW